MLKKIIIDTSPIIFLSKINYLNLLNKLFFEKITIPQSPIDELYRYKIPASENLLIQKFLKNNQVVNTIEKKINSTSLSDIDNEILTHAIKNTYDLIITDDNHIRKIAAHEKILAIGTLGVLIKLIEKKILKADIVKQEINNLIEYHGLRISLDVYKKVYEHIKIYEE
ncbi:MAG TPA: hypothetical protein DC049_08560 [Spirochaetia bacterium]|nr:hypothetical protein [Spirochaetia bacterium]